MGKRDTAFAWLGRPASYDTNAKRDGSKESGARALHRPAARRGVRDPRSRLFPGRAVGNRRARVGARPRPGRRRAGPRDATLVRALDDGPVSYTHLRAHETGRNLV